MKKSRFTDAQIMGVLRQAEGGLPDHCLKSEAFPSPGSCSPKLVQACEGADRHGECEAGSDAV